MNELRYPARWKTDSVENIVNFALDAEAMFFASLGVLSSVPVLLECYGMAMRHGHVAAFQHAPKTCWIGIPLVAGAWFGLAAVARAINNDSFAFQRVEHEIARSINQRKPRTTELAGGSVWLGTSDAIYASSSRDEEYRAQAATNIATSPVVVSILSLN